MGAQDAGVSALAKALMYNKGLTELDLRNNGITAGGGTALGHILASNTGLRRVDLRNAPSFRPHHVRTQEGRPSLALRCVLNLELSTLNYWL